MVEGFNGCLVGSVNDPDASQRSALLAATESTSSNHFVRMLGQESEMGWHMLLPLGQPLRLIRIHILELDDKQHPRLPSLA